MRPGRRPCGRWDHPRSRGVYCQDIPSARAMRGSSPLARGLRRGGAGVHVRDGIIPARAGFTRSSAGGRPRSPDHPRSRGVYPEPPCPTPSGAGSSPLARGLPDPLRPHLPQVRIIPARAGFTCTPRATGRSWRDHPRSRGVYIAEARNALRFIGSSPLARGLRANYVDDGAAVGIIPARAGFTAAVPGPRGHHGDHPRSRGVY